MNMKLTDIISKNAIVAQLKSKDKKGVIKELAQVVRSVYNPSKLGVNDIVKAIMSREKTGSTGVGSGVAIPHAKVDEVKTVIGAFGRSAEGIDFDAVDGGLVHLVFLILAPADKEKANLHVMALQKMMQAVRHPHFSQFLKNAKTAKEIEEIFRDVDEAVTV